MFVCNMCSKISLTTVLLNHKYSFDSVDSEQVF